MEALDHTKAVVVPADAQRRGTTTALGATTVADACKVDGVGGIGALVGVLVQVLDRSANTS
eukprot:5073170-Prymnesium_polylepis.1